MPKPATPTGSKPPADDRNLVAVDETYVAPGLEDKLRILWEKQSKTIIAAIALVACALIGRAVWHYEAAQNELAISGEFGAATTDSALKSFIVEYPNHPLAGEAELRLADNAYRAGNFTEAQADYGKAQTLLTTDPVSLLAPRAELGAAVSQLAAGHDAEGAAALKRLADNSARPKGIRGQAAYDLASIAADAGRTADLDQLKAQISQIDPTGIWATNANNLKARPSGLSSTTSPSLPSKVTPDVPASGAQPASSSSLPVIKRDNN